MRMGGVACVVCVFEVCDCLMSVVISLKQVLLWYVCFKSVCVSVWNV